MTFIVYMATCKKNGKKYVGKTCSGLERRRKEHFWTAGRMRTNFAYALRKYGEDGFDWVVLYEGVNNVEISAVEKAMIAQYGTMAPNGYNGTSGGTGGAVHKISKPIVCVETGERWPSFKACARSFGVRGYTQLRRCIDQSNRTFHGLHFNSEDGACKGEFAKKWKPNTKPVWCLETGDFWHSQQQCQVSLGGPKGTSHLYKCIDKPNRTWKGLHFVSHVG